MSRYAIISKGLPLAEVENQVKIAGGKNVRIARISRQVFCELDDAAVPRLGMVPGLVIKRLKKVGATRTVGAVLPPAALREQEVPVYGSFQATLGAELYELRQQLDPYNLSTIAILDSGVRKTHEGLRGLVTHEANLSNSPTVDDVFDHGTGVAYCAAGGTHGPGEECGAAPGAPIWNIKVLDDNGIGDEENAVLGIEYCVEKRQQMMEEEGLVYTNVRLPQLINISWGGADDGDPDNPIRVACLAAVMNQMAVLAAAGNEGPGEGTIMLPACDPAVIAVGAVTFTPFQIWEGSSRGPSKEGMVKPEFVFYGVRVLTASCKGDDKYVVKSGTSFSAPYMTGMSAIVMGLLYQQYGGYGEAATYLTLGEAGAMSALALALSEYLAVGAPPTIKPTGYDPRVKDNTYGYGMPLGSLISPPAAALDISAVFPIMTLGMVGMMMAGMAKGMK